MDISTCRTGSTGSVSLGKTASCRARRSLLHFRWLLAVLAIGRTSQRHDRVLKQRQTRLHDEQVQANRSQKQRRSTNPSITARVAGRRGRLLVGERSARPVAQQGEPFLRVCLRYCRAHLLVSRIGCGQCHTRSLHSGHSSGAATEGPDEKHRMDGHLERTNKCSYNGRIVMTAPRRPPISESAKILVWARAAGRCTLCNALVTENEHLGEAVPIGELAHNVGWGESSPRGDSDLSAAQRGDADNLLLLCRNCHKPIDANGAIGRYSVDELARFKREHEQRVEMLTAVGADRKATLIRMVGTIRGAQPELTYDAVLGALVKSGHFPDLLPNAFRAEYELDLRSIAEPYTADSYAICARQIDALVGRINEGIKLGAVTRLAAFGFARIPFLIYLGAQLDDKVATLIFQRQRTDDANAWCWPEAYDVVDFDVSLLKPGSEPGNVALLINLSGTIGIEELPEAQQATYSVYSVDPSSPVVAGPTLVNSPDTLANFDHAVREFLAVVERNHGKIARVDVFAAVPVSAAVSIGRALMPNVSPALRVFDRDETGQFFEALEVQR